MPCLACAPPFLHLLSLYIVMTLPSLHPSAFVENVYYAVLGIYIVYECVHVRYTAEFHGYYNHFNNLSCTFALPKSSTEVIRMFIMRTISFVKCGGLRDRVNCNHSIH